MRFGLIVVLVLSWAWAEREVVAPRVRVLYDDPALGAYAQRVAHEAERALDVLEPLFGELPGVVTLRLRDDTDAFNAFARQLPHLYVDVRALFPIEGTIGFGAEDNVFLLVLHELTHIAQYAYTALPEGVPSAPHLGLVGEGVARVPPAWFVEGIATWLESEYTGGGRRDEGVTRGVLWTLAASERWPSLSEVSLGVYDEWPGGSARYLLGVGFVDFLVERHGFEALRATLRAYNAGGFFGTFEAAWLEAIGSELEGEWTAWQAELRTQAGTRQPWTNGEPLTESGWTTGAPSLSPSGKRLAWVGVPSAIQVAPWNEATGLGEVTTVLRDRSPEHLAWLDEATLVYNRQVRRAGSQYLELFHLDLRSARETQLTEGARAHLPSVTPEGCILYVEDSVLTYLSEGSSLLKWCAGETSLVWEVPGGAHIVGLALSPAGRVALSLWRAGRVDLALLEAGELRFLTEDAAVDLEPSWQGETGLLFSSDRSAAGTFDAYRLEPDSGWLERLTDTLGGAFEPLATGDTLLYRTLSDEGYDLAQMELTTLEETPYALEPPLPETEPDEAMFAVRPYSPWPSLVPYGWLPLDVSASLEPLGLSLAFSVLGQDVNNEHGYALSFGYAPQLSGPLGGFHADVNYRYRANTVLTQLVPPYPVGFGLRMGLWPHQPHLLPTTEVTLGAQASLHLTLPQDLWTLYGKVQAGLLYLPSYGGWQPDARLELLLSRLRSDDWGYPTRGVRYALFGVLSAASEGSSAGLWGGAAYHRPLPLGDLEGTLELSLRLGYRLSPPVPLRLEPLAAVGTAGYRVSFSTPLRYGDGLYALERLTLEPRARLWHDGQLGVGGDLSLHADTLVNYAAPVSLGVTLGYAEGFWYRLGLRLPL